MTGWCARCGAQVAEHHHPTGRLAGRYLDPTFTTGFCLRCHHALHARHEALGLARPAPTISLLEQVALVLRRLAVCVAHIGDGPDGFWSGVADVLRSMADDLDRAVAALDTVAPAWRTHPDLTNRTATRSTNP